MIFVIFVKFEISINKHEAIHSPGTAPLRILIK